MDVRRIALVTGGLAAAVVLFLVLRPADENDEAAAPAATTARARTVETAAPQTTTDAPEVARFTIENAGRGGELKELQVKRGEKVVLVVSSDRVDHVHVHGIDVLADVGPGKPATLTFTPTIAGRYEIELEDAGLQIAQLNVTP